MKKLIAILTLCAMLLSAVACSATPSDTNSPSVSAPGALTSKDYTDILVSVRSEDDPNPISGRDENGEIVRTYDDNSYEMTEEDKAYVAFEGVLKHLENVGSFTVDYEKRFEIEEEATKDMEGASQEELTQASRKALLDYYSGLANVTLSDAEIAEIGEKAIEEEKVILAESLKEQLRMELEVAGLTDTDLGEFAYSTTLMMTRAYGIGIFMPAEGKTETVKNALNGFVEIQKQSFETYLVDQFEIAKQAIVEELPTGEVVLVMCENAADVFEAIKTAIAK